ncbi:uncharacterized protein LOC141660198 [Apium graveolens]|uniref:uncharacterized protein LOC141660198 n=1 Tax=Apium graveolens TaxID=4045 RepID=UPI003D790B48
MKESGSLDDFYMKLHGLVTNIRALGETMEESYVVKKLLRAVPSRFLHIASAIEQFGKLEGMSVEEVVGSLKAHEERVRGRKDTGAGQGQLLLTEEEWKRRENQEECRKPRRDREMGKEVNLSQIQGDEPALLVAEIENKEKVIMLVKEGNVFPKLRAKGESQRRSQVWYLDNGASNHMTGEEGKFKTLDKSVTGQVKFGDGSVVT